HSCNLSVNEDFDGVGDNTNLLTGTDVLEVGEGGSVTLFVTVFPGPNPGTFVNNASASGTSLLGADVEHISESTTVDLGPSVIQGIDDFVLYAEHKVQLDEIDDSFGHIGTNGMIEVKNGVSGILAGDLRAQDLIKVNGQIMVDYVFTNNVVLIDGKNAILDVTGSVTEFANQLMLYLPSISFGAGGEDIKVPENGSESLAQASYGKVSVGKGAELLLVGGDYFIEELYVDDDATIWFDPADGPITLNVKKKLDLGESIEMKLSSGRTRDITINVLQEEEQIIIGSGTIVRGTLVAPYAKVAFKECSRLEGACYAEFICLDKGVITKYHNECDGLIYQGFDSNCDGTTDCLESTSEFNECSVSNKKRIK
ncbi:MAG: hypothetical protein ACYST3_01550, partial [Planctomycetota bacterium]